MSTIEAELIAARRENMILKAQIVVLEGRLTRMSRASLMSAEERAFYDKIDPPRSPDTLTRKD